MAQYFNTVRELIERGRVGDSADNIYSIAAVPPADYEVITDYVATCPNCQQLLPTTQHNNQFAYDETVKCACGKTTRVIWSNWL